MASFIDTAALGHRVPSARAVQGPKVQPGVSPWRAAGSSRRSWKSAQVLTAAMQGRAQVSAWRRIAPGAMGLSLDVEGRTLLAHEDTCRIRTCPLHGPAILIRPIPDRVHASPPIDALAQHLPGPEERHVPPGKLDRHARPGVALDTLPTEVRGEPAELPTLDTSASGEVGGHVLRLHLDGDVDIGGGEQSLPGSDPSDGLGSRHRLIVPGMPVGRGAVRAPHLGSPRHGGGAAQGIESRCARSFWRRSRPSLARMFPRSCSHLADRVADRASHAGTVIGGQGVGMRDADPVGRDRVFGESPAGCRR